MTDSTHTPERTNPFPGLRPFEPEEAHLFFGREGQSDELLRGLKKTRFLAVVGTSGSGKSSLIRAGLLPALHAGYMVEEGSTWRIALIRPGHDPIGNLAQQLQHAQQQVDERVTGHHDDHQEDQVIKQALLEATLRRSARGLIEAAQYIQLGPQENLLVVVDQFEELFRFQKDIKGGKEEAAAFVKLLLEAVAQRDVPIFIVLTMRSDFLGDCAQFRDLPEAFNAGQYLIPRMTRDQRRVSITGPVAVASGAIAPRLVQTLLNTVGDDQDQLPILQHTLMRTYEHWKATCKKGNPIDLADYQRVGDLDHALSQHADEIYDRLPTERAKTIAEKIFKCLTEKARDNRETRRQTKLKTLREVAGATIEDVVEVIDQFRSKDCSFLMPSKPTVLTDETLIDISHETLIRKWGRLYAWVKEEDASRAIYLRLVDAAQRYEKQEGNLLRDPELAIALKWQDTQKPTITWAAQYNKRFDPTMDFLNKSIDEQARWVQEAKLAEVALILGDISHDVKNLLMPVLCGVALLKDEIDETFGNLPNLPPDKITASQQVCHEVIQMLSKNAKRVQDRVKEIADCVKGVSSPPKFAPCELVQVVVSVFDTLHLTANEKGISLHHEGIQGLPPIQADEVRLFNVFYNLVNNAIAEVPSGGSIMIHGKLLGPEQTVHIEVQDTGHGMPAEIRDSLFTPSTLSKKKMGSGLGTKIVKDVVEAHHGKITVESEIGKGTTFNIKLPVAPASRTNL